ncbi:DUF2634 domain-containing protein [Cohnella sp. LGH]|uniref:DUF2634 domain-containing protein n=1 Tax=Cohnella sp. LGH TaxID=1619153 RepID=UPI001AD98313|nr:DUF2634 domain-containing protein [Cohnella sp. LGH]QTH44970.1 DUF2634 domain-containing protein [Cohnella sp. LGH]
MIPVGASIADTAVQEVTQPSRTYKLDFARGRVAGKTDGLEAVKQAVVKILQSDRFFHEIYSFDYGHELGAVIGGAPAFVRSEVSRRIQEALLQDDRIVAVQNMQVTIEGDSFTASFLVISTEGSFQQEVGNGV